MQSLFVKNYFQKLLLSAVLICASAPVQAQITPDNTLGAESSRINPNVLIKGALGDSIDGGAQRGINLFHSFSEFNILDGQRVYFVNPNGVTNILTRVTGSNVSNILGTLGVDGAANLFLINPNGILFGKNASLDIGGSFVGTTANALQFGNQGIFSATNADSAPLLTINPSAFLFNQINPGSIVNQSQAPAGINPAGYNTTGLRVLDGKSFALVGGDINLDGGRIGAYSGRVELAGLRAPGSIGLNIAGDEISLNVGNNLQLANISLSNVGVVDVQGAGGGDIVVNARNLNMSNSYLLAGISRKNGSNNTTAGNITLNATEAITATQASRIYNYIDSEAKGDAGNININTSILSLLGGSEINTNTYGQGNAGSININASKSVILDGGDTTSTTGASDIPSHIISGVNSEGIGKAGDINIKTPSLQLTNGAFINSSILGKGDTGNIIIDASDVALSGASISNYIYGIGEGGDIQFNTNTLSLLAGSEIFSKLSGQGNGGNIEVNARSSLKLDGIVGNSRSGIKSSTLPGSIGNSGNIEITTGSMSITNGAKIDTSALGKGNSGNITVRAIDTITIEGFDPVSNSPSLINSSAGFLEPGNSGNIRINTKELYLKNSGQITAYNFGKGDAGSIYIQAPNKISLSNDNNIGYTAISNFVDSGYGNGAVINIETGDLLLNNALINSLNFGKGSAGSIFINAKNTVALINKSSFASSIHLKAEGYGGDINIQSEKLFLDNGSYFTAATSGQGNGGNISINTTDSVSLVNNSYMNSGTFTEAVGNSGDININTIKLSLDTNSYLSTVTFGKGNAGNLTVKATDFSLSNKSYIASGLYQTSVGNGGNIDIQNGALSIENASSITSINYGGKGNAGNILINATGDVSLKNASQINAATYGQGNAGDITVNSGGTVSLTGSDTAYSAIYSIVGWDAVNVGTGIGGNINLNARNLSMNRAGLSSSSFGEGDGGDINVNTGAARLDNQSTIASVTNSDNGGNIKFNATDYLLLRRNSSVQTTAGLDNKSGGNGGNINIQAPFIIALPNEYSFIAANAFTGSGGNVRIGAESVIGIDARNKPTGVTSEITASSQFGVQGTVGITQPEIQPTKTITSLPVQVVDATTKLSQICPRDIGSKPLGEFVITGRGSLPPSPLEPLPGTNSPTLVSIEKEPRQVQNWAHVEQEEPEAPIVEAQGWVRNNDGSVELVAVAPNVNALSTSTQAKCPSVARSS